MQAGLGGWLHRARHAFVGAPGVRLWLIPEASQCQIKQPRRRSRCQARQSQRNSAWQRQRPAARQRRDKGEAGCAEAAKGSSNPQY